MKIGPHGNGFPHSEKIKKNFLLMKGNWKGYRGTGFDQIVNLKCEVNERLVCVLTYYGTLEKRSRSLVILVLTP